MRSSPDSRTITIHPPSRHREAEYRRDEEHHSRSPGHHHHFARDERGHDVSYRYVRTQAPPISSKEAIQKLSIVATNTLQLFQSLQSSFACETAKLRYVEEQIMDYIWEDKLNYADKHGIDSTSSSAAENQHASNSNNAEDPHHELIPLNAQPVGIKSTLRHLHQTLDTAVSATVYETKFSAGDNRTLAEKLNRMANDIDKSRDGIFTRREVMDTLVTDLEMLGVLLKRHGGGGGGTAEQRKERSTSDVSAGREAPVQRQMIFEHASVVDEKEEGNDGGFDEQTETGSGARAVDREKELGTGNEDTAIPDQSTAGSA